MKAQALPFHVQQNTTLEALEATLAGCHQGTTIDHLAYELSKSVGTMQHVVRFMRQLDLIDSKHLVLTDSGSEFYRLHEQMSSMLAEAVHHVLYTAHGFDKAKRFSWAYAMVADTLWTSAVRVLDDRTKAQLVGKVVHEAGQAFGIVDQVAFSRHSIHGVLNWLRVLDPPTVTNRGRQDSFRRRHYCPPLALLWAVDFLYRAEARPHGVRMFLPPERIEKLCKLCVLDPAGLDNVLMMARRTSDCAHGGLFDYGTEGGFGRWILLVRPCPVPTFEVV